MMAELVDYCEGFSEGAIAVRLVSLGSAVAISIELDLKEPAEHSKILEKIGSLDYVNYLEEG